MPRFEYSVGVSLIHEGGPANKAGEQLVDVMDVYDMNNAMLLRALPCLTSQESPPSLRQSKKPPPSWP